MEELKLNNNSYAIRDCILNCSINEKQDAYIQPLDELSSYLVYNFFDYAVYFDTSLKCIDEIEKGNFTRERFSKTVYTLYKFMQNKWENENNSGENIINRSSFLIHIPDTSTNFAINFPLCLDELFESMKEFIIAFRKWSMETIESSWKRNVRDLSPYMESMFKELYFFKLELYSAYLNDGSYDDKVVFASPFSQIRNIYGLNSNIRDFTRSVTDIYNDINSISYLIRATINFSTPIDMSIRNDIFKAQNPNIKQQINNEEEDW